MATFVYSATMSVDGFIAGADGVAHIPLATSLRDHVVR